MAEGGGEGDGGDKFGIGILATSTSTSGTVSSLLWESSASSSATSYWSCCRRRKEIGITMAHSMVKTRGHLILLSIRGSSGTPKCSRTWLNSRDINKGKLSARAARPLQWTLSSKCSKVVMTNSEGLNQNPSEIQYKASSMAPLRWT